ncbi:MAG: hypothetical protein IJS88_05530 [Alphaproteobacteria bacterium]|nr:hypothetical protein [Alphaproteobacteria bacterium]
MLRYYISAVTVERWEKYKYLLSFLTSSFTVIFGMLIAVFMYNAQASQMIDQAKYAYNSAPYDSIIDENFVRSKTLCFNNPNPKNVIIIFALGTSLLSAEQTLQETYGKTLNKRLLNNSKFYEDFVLSKSSKKREADY